MASALADKERATMIEVTLPEPVHFCPAYPARILVAPAGAKRVKLRIDASTRSTIARLSCTF